MTPFLFFLLFAGVALSFSPASEEADFENEDDQEPEPEMDPEPAPLRSTEESSAGLNSGFDDLLGSVEDADTLPSRDDYIDIGLERFDITDDTTSAYDIIDFDSRDDLGSYLFELTDGATQFNAPDSLNTVIFGSDSADDLSLDTAGQGVIFAGAGDDELEVSNVSSGLSVLLGEDGNDRLDGAQTGGQFYGGDGDDVITSGLFAPYDNSSSQPTIVNGGAGDDTIAIAASLAVIETGDGADEVFVMGATQSGELVDNYTVFTDFDPFEDGLQLAVVLDSAEAFDPFEITYILTEIETDAGPATLVTPALDPIADPSGLDFEGASVSHAVLLGVTPDQLGDANIIVTVFQDGATPL